MSPPTAPTALTSDPHLADMIARAERRRFMLERLATIGMALAEEIRERNVNAPYHPEPRHDPGRAYAAVSRAVRLTLRLETRIDNDILAMRNGRLPIRHVAADRRTATAPAMEAEGLAPALATVSENQPSIHETAREAIDRESIDREAGDVEEARFARSRVRQRRIQTEGDDGLFNHPHRETVETVRADPDLNSAWDGGSASSACDTAGRLPAAEPGMKARGHGPP